jgi:hypothetical protein
VHLATVVTLAPRIAVWTADVVTRDTSAVGPSAVLMDESAALLVSVVMRVITVVLEVEQLDGADAVLQGIPAAETHVALKMRRARMVFARVHQPHAVPCSRPLNRPLNQNLLLQ